MWWRTSEDGHLLEMNSHSNGRWGLGKRRKDHDEERIKEERLRISRERRQTQAEKTTRDLSSVGYQFEIGSVVLNNPDSTSTSEDCNWLHERVDNVIFLVLRLDGPGGSIPVHFQHVEVLNENFDSTEAFDSLIQVRERWQ